MSLLNKLFGQTNLSETQRNALEAVLESIHLDGIESEAFRPKQLQNLKLSQKKLSLEWHLPFAAKSLWPALEQQLTHALLPLDGIESVSIDFHTHIEAHAVQGGIQPLADVKNILAVASGKGGVGKSTTSVNLALALQQEGARVGLLDADIYGPSIPTMLGIHDKPQTLDGKSMEPLSAYGLQLMSIGFLINPDDPMIWRGPIVTSTLTQLLNETNWQALDYLVIDLPPGTGDVQLTLSQQIPVTGAVIVTTPQEVALIDARKGLKMFEKVKIPILGIIENMSTHICSQCGHEEAIFGEHGGQRLAEQFQVPFLGALPLERRIREESDQGKPTVTAAPTSDISQKYRHIAHQISAQIASKRRDYSAAFPKIVVENR